MSQLFKGQFVPVFSFQPLGSHSYYLAFNKQTLISCLKLAGEFYWISPAELKNVISLRIHSLLNVTATSTSPAMFFALSGEHVELCSGVKQFMAGEQPMNCYELVTEALAYAYVTNYNCPHKIK